MAKKKKAVARKKTIVPAPVTVPPKPLKKVTLEINTNKIEESIHQLVDQVQYWYKQGMIHKIRLKYKGKAILPDIPLSYFMVAQVASFFLAGVVRALAISLGTRVFFEVEMVNDAEQVFQRARDLYLDGDFDEAARLFEQVLQLDHKYSEAYLYIGIIHRVRNDHVTARRYFEKVRQLDPRGKAGAEAEKNLKKMGM
jgi:tetratricopeptide (TPR) repeat protein